MWQNYQTIVRFYMNFENDQYSNVKQKLQTCKTTQEEMGNDGFKVKKVLSSCSCTERIRCLEGERQSKGKQREKANIEFCNYKK